LKRTIAIGDIHGCAQALAALIDVLAPTSSDTLVVLGDYLFSIAAMYVFNDRLGIDYRLVRIASIALAVSWNFFLYKYWVYEEGAQASVGQQP
jgi:predicted neutral ceramidase superfamily lipid hydrolase